MQGLLRVILVLVLCSSAGWANAQTIIGGVIVSDTTLVADTYHLTSDLTVNAGVTLTLEPGVIIKSSPGLDILIDGHLQAVGTQADPIHFTEVRDASVGLPIAPGDPAPGAWIGIEVRNGGSADLERVRIRYTGSSFSQIGAVRKTGSGSLTLTDSEITLAARSGLVVTNLSGTVSVSDSQISQISQVGVLVEFGSGTVTLTDNQISGSAPGLRFSSFAGTLSMTGNQVTGSNEAGMFIEGLPILGGITGNTLTGNVQSFGPIRMTPNASGTVIDASNTLDGPLRIEGGNFAAGLTTWVNPFTYRLTGSHNVPAEGTLSLPPGTVVKADFGSTQLIIEGLLEAVGTPVAPVVFTEIRDDSAGGSSGFAGDPAPGSWIGIDVRNGGSAVLEQTRIRYAGASPSQTAALRKLGSGDLMLIGSELTLGSRDGVLIDGASDNLLLQANRIEEQGGQGMIIRNATGSVQLQSNRIMNNGGNGLLIDNASPLIERSRFIGNGAAGVRVSGELASPVLDTNLISGNVVGIDSYSGANPLIGGSEGTGNDVVDNTQFGVRNNDSGLTLNARFNWWGHPSGPLDPIDNPDGLGNAVSEWVDYGDFLDRSAFDEVLSDRFQAEP